jgi:hypothetical protein
MLNLDGYGSCHQLVYIWPAFNEGHAHGGHDGCLNMSNAQALKRHVAAVLLYIGRAKVTVCIE